MVLLLLLLLPVELLLLWVLASLERAMVLIKGVSCLLVFLLCVYVRT